MDFVCYRPYSTTPPISFSVAYRALWRLLLVSMFFLLPEPTVQFGLTAENDIFNVGFDDKIVEYSAANSL